MQPADTVGHPCALPIRMADPVPIGVDPCVQPTDERAAKREARRPAVQEPDRLPMEDAADGGALGLVQRCVPFSCFYTSDTLTPF